MKRKILSALFVLVLAFCLLSLFACSEDNVSTEDNSVIEHTHSYIETVISPTCTEKGYTLHSCTCGKTYKDNYVDAKGHNYNSVITEPTCTLGGCTTYTCSCGDSYIDNYTKELGHEFTNYISNNNATYENDGTKTAMCDRIGCNAVDTIIEENSKLEEIIVSYNANGGKNAPSSQKFNNEIISLSSVVPERNGYVFTGWNNIYENKVYQPNDEFGMNKSITFFAMWEKICETCKGEGEINKYQGNCVKCQGNGKKCRSCGFYSTKKLWGSGGYYWVCNTCIINDIINCDICNGLGGIYAIETCEECNGSSYDKLEAPSCKGNYGNAIVLNSISGFEYSKDGVNWQKSSVFKNLALNTSYTFYQRMATTETHPFSNTSYPLRIKTNSTKVKREYLRIDKNGVEKVDGSYIMFGTYPQTDVTNSMGYVLNSYVGTLPTSSNSGAWTSYRYYIRGSIANYMWYKDVTYSGEKYRAVYFTSYRPYFLTHDSTSTTTFQDDNGYLKNKVYWFRFEPIKWRILNDDNGEAIILCDTIIDCMQFDDNMNSMNSYADSTIRTWLNNQFYNLAFNSNEKGLINRAIVSNKASTTGDVNNSFICPDTEDNIFLLSYEEVTNSKYGFDANFENYDVLRQKVNTGYSKVLGCMASTLEQYCGNGVWRLRSSGGNSYSPYVVKISGRLLNESLYVDDTYIGVVPALRVYLI